GDRAATFDICLLSGEDVFVSEVSDACSQFDSRIAPDLATQRSLPLFCQQTCAKSRDSHQGHAARPFTRKSAHIVGAGSANAQRQVSSLLEQLGPLTA